MTTQRLSTTLKFNREGSSAISLCCDSLRNAQRRLRNSDVHDVFSGTIESAMSRNTVAAPLLTITEH